MYQSVGVIRMKPELNSYSFDVKKYLTKREIEVLICLATGKNNREIADELIVSVHTVKAHVSNILEKLEVDCRVMAAVKAFKLGLIQ